MFRTEIVRHIGMYNEEMLLAEEIEFQNRFEAKYKISHIGLPLYRYCQHGDNLTGDSDLYGQFKEKLNEK